MSTTPAIRISNLSKAYRIQRDDSPRATNLGEAFTRKLRTPFKRTPTETFWALKDIDLEIERGEVVGVIGRNGAGKSTLLKVLSRITEPTTGRIELFGRVGSLLEVGTGFHPELTGRENIFLNGAILGMRRGEIKKQFDAIVDFAGVEKFLDTPVKRYSSGMYVRLAFAVAAHLNPEILIVDEVLAVGDAEFQKKCLGKMKDVARSGRTVLFVSHNMHAIQTLCNKGIFLRDGSASHPCGVAEAVATYRRCLDYNVGSSFEDDINRSGSIRFSAHTALSNKDNLVGLLFQLELKCNRPTRITKIGIGINDASGHRICTLLSDAVTTPLPATVSGSYYSEISMASPTLTPGIYRVKLAIDSAEGAYYENEDCLMFETVATPSAGQPLKIPAANQGAVIPEIKWNSRFTQL